ncbi:MAG TPA: MEDS domain-containing protein [Burkholderiales bacterium]
MSHEHFVQLYQDSAALADAVAEYVCEGLRRGEAAVIIATAQHREAFLSRIGAFNADQLKVLDAEQTLATFLVNGIPNWQAFRATIGGLIAELRLRYPTVRAYGEMVDVLWQRGEREAAIRLEEYWNELGQLQTFSLFCAYRMDPLDGALYGGPLESVCRVHAHLAPARDQQRIDAAVHEASRKVLDQPLAAILLSMAANHGRQVPAAQATLFWLKQNMPRAADQVFQQLKGAASREA